MDHELAAQTHAVDRYVLGEMPVEERDAFEEHYADCKECLSGVHGMVAFAENARAVFEERERARQERPVVHETRVRKWLAWLTPQTAIPAFAALALAAVVGYQSLVIIPGLRAPQANGPGMIFDGETRSAVKQIKAGEPLKFRMGLNQSAVESPVALEVIDAAGHVVQRGVMKAPGLHQPLDVYWPGKLNPGHYTLVVLTSPAGQTGTELARNQFEVVSQEARTK